MIIGSDFDGVIADTASLLAFGISLDAIVNGDIDVKHLRPLSESMIRLLDSNAIAVVITARPTLPPVHHWLSHHAPGFRGLSRAHTIMKTFPAT